MTIKITEGNVYGFWSFNGATGQKNLQMGTIYLCEACKAPASVNSVWVVNGTNPKTVETLRAQADQIAEIGEVTELSLYEDDQGNQDHLCEKCGCNRE